MSLPRFKEINRCLRFDDKEQRDRHRDKLAPIRFIFDKWVQRLKVSYCVGDFVTVDEQLVPYRGRSPFTQYIPSKPAKYGLKLWVAADAETFYAYNMQVYVGRDRNCATEVNQGQRVVLDMTEGLNGRNVTCDNFFTSRNLAIELKKRQITLVGTIRKNRKEIPPLLVDMKKKPVHHTEVLYDHHARACMLSYVPKKRKFVSLYSTYHSAVHIEDTDPEKKPDVIKFYNRTKGGVDVLDKLVGTYRCKRKVNRWPIALFCNMLDVSASNAYIIFVKLNPEWNISKKGIRRRLFLIEVGESLCVPSIEQRKHMPRCSNAVAVIQRVRNIASEGPSTSQSSRHSMSRTPKSNKRARCYMCPSKSNANIYSARCDKCAKYICPAHRYIFCEKCTEP
ncbi:PREDICTED: piggyBac transposable element-derived protein 4-like [Rhagoletis zephyria]|uniref:piggyBac transposable element-derived protein 4-like n=1 Tax=Rhagoletis zephyria TaxID=28612 RepID=UPI00081147AA|nr:PREDICTED: piggyBac transposable element-derived protein 4-like [Rhagoletis zephyria]